MSNRPFAAKSHNVGLRLSDDVITRVLAVLRPEEKEEIDAWGSILERTPSQVLSMQVATALLQLLDEWEIASRGETDSE